jgi:uncharacterized membrane protein
MKKNIAQYLKANQKVIIMLGITTVFFLIAIWFFCGKYYISVSPHVYMKNEGTSETTELLLEGDCVEQSFQFSGEVNGAVFCMGTYGTKVNGILSVSIYSGDNLLAFGEKDLSEIEDGQNFTVELKEPVLLTDGNDYTFRCDITGLSENSQLVFFGSEGDGSGSIFSQNNYGEDITITFGIFGLSSKVSQIQTLFLVVITLLWVLVISLELLVIYTKLPVHKIFLIFAVALGLFYQFILPPISAPDEDAHAAMSFYYSNYLWGKTEILPVTSNKKFSLIEARQVEKDFLKRYHINPTGEDYLNTLNGFTEEADSNNAINAQMQARIIKATPIAYLPQIIGITIARVLGLNGVLTVYLGRLCSMLAYITLAYWGIKKIPFKKMMLAIVALLPMTIHLAASYSYDSILLGAAFFYVGELFQLAYTKDKIGWRDWVCLGVSVILLSSGKGIYILMMGLCIIIPWQTYGGKIKKVLGLATIGVTSVACFLINMLPLLMSRVDKLFETGNYSIQILWQAPLDTMWLFVNTMVTNIGWYIGSMVGQYLGWFDVNVPIAIVFAIIVLLFLSAVPNEKNEIRLKMQDRFISIGLFCVIIVVTFVAALSWNDVSSLIIDGIQGRYFLQVLPLLLLGISGFKRLKITHSIDRFLWCGVIWVNLFSLVSAFNKIATR